MSSLVVVSAEPRLQLSEDIWFKIFNFLTIDEIFVISMVCKQWNQTFNNYLKSEFFDKNSFGFQICMNQLPDIYRECLNADQSDVLKRWRCADVSHRSGNGMFVKDLKRCKEQDSSLIRILENSIELQSLDLRGLTIDVHLLKIINDFCPELECLHMNSVKIDSKAFNYLCKKIVPKLIHLSIDNMFEVIDWDKHHSVWHQLFRRTINLEDIKFDIFPEKSQFIASSLSELCGNLVFIHINLFSKSEKPNPIKFRQIVENLTIGFGRGIQFLRLYSEEENDVFSSKPQMNRFLHLRALNLSLRNKNHYDFIYQTVCDNPGLESLTLDLSHLVGPQPMLERYLNCEFRTNVFRLKLENVVINKQLSDCLKNNYKNLNFIIFIDIYFENNELFIEFIKNNHKLSYLCLHFTCNQKSSELKHFPEDMFYDYIMESKYLNELYLINCPLIDSNKCTQICKQKDIDFYFENHI